MRTNLPSLAAAIVLEVTATLALRAMNGLADPWWIIVVILGYVGSFLLFARILQTGVAVGVLYGVWSAAGVILTAIFGAAIFGEPLTLLMVLGIALVIGGVFLVELGSQSPHRNADR